jgi:hypothetical protein
MAATATWAGPLGGLPLAPLHATPRSLLRICQPLALGWYTVGENKLQLPSACSGSMISLDTVSLFNCIEVCMVHAAPCMHGRDCGNDLTSTKLGSRPLEDMSTSVFKKKGGGEWHACMEMTVLAELGARCLTPVHYIRRYVLPQSTVQYLLCVM